MPEVLGDLLPYGVAVALSPLPIISTVMLLLAPAGVRGGLAFLAGRVATLAALALVFGTLAGASGGGGRETPAWLSILIGFGLMAGAIVVWRRHRAAGGAEMPAWLRAIDRATPAVAARHGLVLTLVNLKEVAIALGAGAIIGTAGLARWPAVAAALAFAAVAGLGVAVPVLACILGGEPARVQLAGVRDWLVRNQAIALAAVLLVLGAMLVGSGIEAL